MLVIHWAKENRASMILKNGIRPSYRRLDPSWRMARNQKGVYVYPFSPLRTLVGTWKQNLKVWDTFLGNYKGFVFRLQQRDFPVFGGPWHGIREDPDSYLIKTPAELALLWGDFFTGDVANSDYRWRDFEIILPRHIHPRRILKVLEDRQPAESPRERRKH